MRKLLTLVLLGFAFQTANPNSNNSLKVANYSATKIDFPRLRNIMEVLKIVESRNNPKAKSPRGRFLGILQISKSCIAEVNRHFGTNYKHQDAYDVCKSEDIFMKAMQRGITLFKAKYNKKPSEEQLVRMWNGGIYNGYKKPSTKKYYATYLKHKSKFEKNTLTI